MRTDHFSFEQPVLAANAAAMAIVETRKFIANVDLKMYCPQHEQKAVQGTQKNKNSKEKSCTHTKKNKVCTENGWQCPPANAPKAGRTKKMECYVG
jgi:hypothetical protein